MNDTLMNDTLMNDTSATPSDSARPPLDEEQQRRREFLLGLGRWSKVVIGAAVLGGLAAPVAEVQAGAWVNRRGGWINGGGGGGGSWVNGGGGGWANRRGGGGWLNGR